MKKIFTPLITVVLLIGILQNPVIAQPASTETTITTDIEQPQDNSGKWGLLGLFGLLGLMGIKKSEKTIRYSKTPTPQNRYSILFSYL